MRKKVLLIIFILFAMSIVNISVSMAGDITQNNQKLITDMVGREISIPTKIDRIFSVNNTGTVLCYCLAPDKVIGWNSKLNNNMKKYIKGKAASLPVLGTLYGNTTANASLEEIMLAAPDIIIFMAPRITNKVIKSADQIQNKLKIPVIIVDGQLKNTDKTLKFLGPILGEEERVDKLANYFSNLYQEVIEVAAQIKDDDKVNVYYARGNNGLTTEIKGSPNTETLRLVGANNVAKLDVDSENFSGLAGNYTVAMEQLLIWNPDIIIVGGGFYTDSELYNNIKKKENWQNIKAVANNQIYFVPTAPFNWFDRPPSLNKILGIIWAAEIIYPDQYSFDIRNEVKEFYSLFYNYDLNEIELNQLLAYTIK